MLLRNLLIGVGLALFFTLNWWLLRSPEETDDDSVVADVQQFGWYLRGATLIGTDAAGDERYRLSARLIEQDPADNSATLTAVRLRYEAAGDPAWQLTADGGWIAADGQTIRLAGNVVMADEPAADSTPTVVRTSRVELLVATDLARTDANVRVENGRNALEALGMEANLRDDRVQLQSDVSGIFYP